VIVSDQLLSLAKADSFPDVFSFLFLLLFVLLFLSNLQMDSGKMYKISGGWSVLFHRSTGSDMEGSNCMSTLSEQNQSSVLDG
jgi:hypothetical protein